MCDGMSMWEFFGQTEHAFVSSTNFQTPIFYSVEVRTIFGRENLFTEASCRSLVDCFFRYCWKTSICLSKSRSFVRSKSYQLAEKPVIPQITRLPVNHLTPQGSQCKKKWSLAKLSTAGKQLSRDTDPFSGREDYPFLPQVDIGQKHACKAKSAVGSISFSAPAHLQHTAT